jgi:DNA-binding response OmpR family regulator
MANRSSRTSAQARLRVLIVEDQNDLAENLFEFLGDEHYSLDYAADGLTALHLLATQNYDVIVLDLMLPGVDGFEICRRIRQDLQCQKPVILMTALSSIADKEKGFHLGADDYLVKPFELKELQLRIDALHRRYAPSSRGLQAGELRFDPGTLSIHYKGKSAELTGTPARLFELLIRAYPSFISHNALSEAIWGDENADTTGHTLRTHVYALRKILDKEFGDGLIKTVHGRGYRLNLPEDEEADQ